LKLILYLALVLWGCQSQTATTGKPEITGKVIKIIDGDTFDILLENNTTKRIRMEGIDAPERGMPYYKVAKDYLGSLCFLQTVHIEHSNIDRYGRTVAKTYGSNGSELGWMMIKAGYAWHFKRYSSDIELAIAEVDARNKKKGLWVDELPIAPWEWRRIKKKKNSLLR